MHKHVQHSIGMSTQQSSKLWYANGDRVDCTTPRAPELFEVPSNCTITAKTDVWSLGCSLYAAAFGVFPLSFPLSTPYRYSTPSQVKVHVMGQHWQPSVAE